MLRSGDSLQPVEGSSRRGKSSARRSAALGVLFVVLGGGVIYGMQVATSQSRPLGATIAGGQPLPDGSMVRVEQVTFGRNHRLGPPRNRRSWLPAWFTGVDPDEPTIEFDHSRDEMVIWITQRHPTLPRRTRMLEWWTDYRLTDSHGCRFDHYSRDLRVQSKTSSSSSSISRGDRFTPPTVSDPKYIAVGVMDLEAFPRREQDMTLQLFGTEGARAAEFKVSNPARGSYPEWTPLPLPQKQRDGDLTVELREVDGIVDSWDSNGVKNHQQRLDPKFRIAQAGKPTDHWKASDIFLSDATGNEVRAYDCRLCLREKAWKLRARLWRKPEAVFAPAETWVVEDVPVQSTGKIQSLSGSAIRQNVKLELLAIAGRGAYEYKDGVPSARKPALSVDHSPRDMSTSGSTSTGAAGRHTRTDLRAGVPHVAVRVSGLTDEYHLDLIAIDERGRQTVSEVSSNMDAEHYLGLDLPKDARKVTLRFTVHRCRTVEFLIRPPQFQSPKRG